MIVVLNKSKLIERYEPVKSQGNTLKANLIALGERLSGKCPLCNGSIAEGGKLVVCPSCLTVYHLNCIDEILSYNNDQNSSFKCIICGYEIPLSSIKKLLGREE